MPGIVNKYFRLSARAPTVAFMTFAPAGCAPPDGFALGVFRRPAGPSGPGLGRTRPGGDVFTGLVRGDRVRDVSTLGTVNDLLADWDNSLGRLAALAADDKGGTGEPGDPGGWADLAALDVRCPVELRQILQVRANYRKHVVDIVMAERRSGESVTGHNSDLPESEVRAWGRGDDGRAGRQRQPVRVHRAAQRPHRALRRDRAPRAGRPARLGTPYRGLRVAPRSAPTSTRPPPPRGHKEVRRHQQPARESFEWSA
jgi:hypothetical protein